jgi:MFS family permease
VLGFVGFVTSFGSHIVAVNLPSYADEVGVGVAMIGLLIAAYDFSEILAKPVFGSLADQHGLRRTILLGIAIFVGSSLLYLVLDPRYLLVVRLLQGVGAAGLSGVSVALVGAYYPDRRGQAYGIYNMLKGIGYVASPAIGGFIVLTGSFRDVFVASALVGSLAFLLTLTLPRRKVPGRDARARTRLSDIFAALRDRRLWPFYAITVVTMFFVGILFGFLPVYVHTLHYAPLDTAIVLTAVTLSYVFVQPFAGMLADQVGATATVRFGLLLAGISLILIPFLRDQSLIVAVIVAGLSIGTVSTNTDAAVSNLAAGNQLATKIGTVGSFKEFGDMIGPLLIGITAQQFGLTTGFILCGALGLLSLLLVRRE